MAKEYVSTQIRIPPPLHRKLARLAEQNRRSLNEEIVWRLEHTIEAGVDDLNTQINDLRRKMDDMSKRVAEVLEENKRAIEGRKR